MGSQQPGDAGPQSLVQACALGGSGEQAAGALVGWFAAHKTGLLGQRGRLLQDALGTFPGLVFGVRQNRA